MAADDGIIKIGTEVDISGIQQGMKEAQAAVTASTSQMEGAYQKLAAATGEYAITQANLRAVISQLVAGQVPYTLAVEALTPALREQSEASKSLQAAKAGLAQAEAEAAGAALSEAAATEVNAAAQRGLMSATTQARFGAQLLGRELGIPLPRALSSVAAQSSLLGPILAGAFPVITAVALGGVLIDLAEKAHHLYEEYIDLNAGAEKFAATVRAGIVHDFVDVRSLEDATDRLDRATRSATALGEAARNIHSISFKELMEGVGTGNLGTIALGLGGLVGAKQIGDQGNVKQGQEIALMTRQVELQHQLRLAQIEAANAAGEHLKGQAKITAELQHQLAVHAEERRYNNERDRAMGNPVSPNSGAQLQAAQDAGSVARAHSQSIVQAEEDARKAAAEVTKQEEEFIRVDRENLDKLKSQRATSALDEASYWESIASTASYGSKEYVTAVDEANKALGRAQQENRELSSRVGDELRETWDAATRSADEAQKKQEELANALGAAADKLTGAQTKAGEAIAEASLKAAEGSGSMTKLSAAHELARIHAQAYREELARLDAELTRVSQDAALTPTQRTNQVGQLQAQKAQVQGQAAASGISDQAAIQQQIAQPYLNAFNQINAGWLQVQDQMLFSTRNLSLAFAKMGQSILISIINSMEKAALVAAEHDLLMVATHQAANQAKVTSDGVAAAQSEAISSGSQLKKLALEIAGLFHHTATNTAKTTSDAASSATSTAAAVSANIAAAQSYAAVAAVAAMASAASIPVIGFALAPAAGAAIYAAAEGFAAMAALDTGTGFVPRDGVAMLHQGEIVVPAPTADELRGGDRDGGDINFTQHNNVHLANDKEFARLLDRHADKVAGALRKHMRQGGKV